MNYKEIFFVCTWRAMNNNNYVTLKSIAIVFLLPLASTAVAVRRCYYWGTALEDDGTLQLPSHSLQCR